MRGELEVAEDQIKESGQTEEALRQQIKRLNAEVATVELQNSKLREDLETSGGDPHAFDQYKDLEAELRRSQESSQRVEKQLRSAMQRVYELQGQLMDKEEAERDRLKAKKAAEEAESSA